MSYVQQFQSEADKVSFNAANCSSPSLILSAISRESIINLAFMLMK